MTRTPSSAKDLTYYKEIPRNTSQMGVFCAQRSESAQSFWLNFEPLLSEKYD